MSYQKETKTTYITPIRLPELELIDKPKIILSKELQSEIMYLHRKVGNVEWSGPMFYKIISGDINDPGNLVIKILHIYPYNVGTASYTEYEFGPEIMDFYDAYPECDPSQGAKWGHQHSHHSMKCFFSGTDMQELHDNAGSHNYYLSLIVNHESQYCAKIAFVAERTIKSKIVNVEEDFLTFKGSDGSSDVINLVKNNASNGGKNTSEKVLVHMDCEIIFEQDEFFKNRVEEIMKPKPIIHTHTNYGANYGHISNYNDPYAKYRGGDEYDDFYNPTTGGRNREKDGKNKTQLNVFEQGELPFDELKVKTFIIKWLAQDVLCEDKLSTVLKELSKTSVGKPIDNLLEKLDETIKTYFAFVFYGNASQVTPNEQEQLCKQCISELNRYKSFSITQDVIDVLDLYIVDENPRTINSMEELYD